jgi:hypothetical protein
METPTWITEKKVRPAHGLTPGIIHPEREVVVTPPREKVVKVLKEDGEAEEYVAIPSTRELKNGDLFCLKGQTSLPVMTSKGIRMRRVDQKGAVFVLKEIEARHEGGPLFHLASKEEVPVTVGRGATEKSWREKVEAVILGKLVRSKFLISKSDVGLFEEELASPGRDPEQSGTLTPAEKKKVDLKEALKRRREGGLF